MDAASVSFSFSLANPHALATILEASETKSIIASQDIFDASGIKLWARDRPVSRELQIKLMDRHLRRPLETCLDVEDGLSPAHLGQAVAELVNSQLPLANLLRPWADQLEYAASHLPLHPVVTLLLTASQVSRPAAFDHAVHAMTLNGALALERGCDPQVLQEALLCGLIHDVGEMYVDPAHGEVDADRDLDVQSYRELVVHPHVGRLLIEQLTDYPRAIARAVAEHHERLDGSGYPHCLRRDEVSPMGRQLAVTEAAIAALRVPPATLSRASVALRVVPGEFDLDWIGLLARAAGQHPSASRRQPIAEIEARLSRLDETLQAGFDSARALMAETENPTLREAIILAGYLLTRLRTGWNASGLWGRAGVDEPDSAEIESIEAELAMRLRGIERAARLRAGALPDVDQERLQRLCEELSTDNL